MAETVTFADASLMAGVLFCLTVSGYYVYFRILAMVNDLGLPLIDTHSTFHAHNDPLALFPFRQPAHYNVEGHRLIAEAVLSSIGK